MLQHLKKKLLGNSSSRSREPKYEALRGSAEEKHYEQKVPGESKRFLLWTSILGILVLCTVGYSFVTVSTSGLHLYAYERYDPRTRRCGDTSGDANRRGCQFDPVLLSWLPEDCLDQELAEEFRALDWALYADKNKSRIRTEEDWSHGKGVGNRVWLTNKDHRIHCAYSWKRMHRAVMLGRSLPIGVISYAETELCVEALTTQMPPDQIALEISLSFPAC